MPRQNSYRALLSSFLFLSSAVGAAWGQGHQTHELETADDSALAIVFERDIQPILSEHCLDCHAGEHAESGLDLSSMLEALRGGDSGEPTIVPGNSLASHLIARLTSQNSAEQMPPADRLEDVQIDRIRQWIDQASAWRAAQEALAEEQPQHWSFQPLQRTRPIHSDVNRLDGFIRDRLAKDGLELSGVAERRRLIRRLYLVMHGLLPTFDQVQHFVEDESSDAWEQLVEEVLHSPRYGERMATHWLDVVRFGETNGFETNRERPLAFHYRDWVVEAFNDDMPYDRFVMSQIAGDAFGEPRGTGFLVAGPHDIVKGQDALLGLMQRQDELTDIVHATGTTFLGLTTGCARCHNHKFDPVTQSDFYALQAIFAGVEHGDAPLPVDATRQASMRAMEAELEQLHEQLAPWRTQPQLREPVNAQHNEERFSPTPARFIRFEILRTNGGEPCLDELQVFGAGEVNFALSSLGTIATSSGDFEHPFHKLEHIHDGRFGNEHSWIASLAQDSWVQLELPQVQSIERISWGRDRQGVYGDRLAIDYRLLASTDGDQWTVLASSHDRRAFGMDDKLQVLYSLEQEPAEVRSQLEKWIARATAVEERLELLKSPQSAYIGRFVQPPAIHRLYRGDPLAPREEVPPAAIATFGTLSLPASASEQQRRVALAHWIVHPDNPLTARVMANRIWQMHFGTGIVDTPSDLGINGTSPSHPELLDWLACELVDHGWSLKALHRTILLSETWRQDSAPNDAGSRTDGSNRLLWRFPPRRLEAEAIRDNMLSVSGALDLTLGGESFSPFEVALENVRHYFPKQEYGPEDWRRMLYMQRVRQEREVTFGAFDCPDPSQAVPQRSRSTTPLQALNLLNSPFVLQQSKIYAETLMKQHDHLSDCIHTVFEASFGRRPADMELNEAAQFAEQYGLESLIRAVFNSNEFLFIP
jgi:hypothetical protein